jgi:starch synthase
MKVLFAASEVHPLAKTGGLADVAGSLPAALTGLGAKLRVVTPAYRGTLALLRGARRVATLTAAGQPIVVWEGTLPDCDVRAWLLDCAPLFDRGGDPYRDAAGVPHPDNALRFGAFSQAVAQLALGEGVDFKCDVVHLNDWQTGLAAAWLRGRAQRPRIVFTIHNLAYQGVYGRAEFDALGLPPALWHWQALEFHGGFSFMKAGILYADAITTVSPTYAREIQTPGFGEGLDGLLRERAAALHGIINGIDTLAWDPSTDGHLRFHYDAQTVSAGKRDNKLALLREAGLPPTEAPLLGIVSRLAHQKGMDLVIAARRGITESGLRLVLLGSGEAPIVASFREWMAEHPDRVSVRIGYDEGFAHRVEAGADLFLMASRYEPCGLNQMYSQRYGTIPVVRRIGGLADTVIDATPENLAAGTATGVVFEHADAAGILYGLNRALALKTDTDAWLKLQRAGMARDFSWRRTAHRYLSLMRGLGAQAATGPA